MNITKYIMHNDSLTYFHGLYFYPCRLGSIKIRFQIQCGQTSDGQKRGRVKRGWSQTFDSAHIEHSPKLHTATKKQTSRLQINHARGKLPLADPTLAYIQGGM
jgi:hypothetical protein